MKKLQIIADPASLDSVMDILNENALHHFTVTELKEYGLGAQTAVFRGQAYNIKFKARVAVEVVLPAEIIQDVVAALHKAVASARQLEVYVSPVERVDLAGQTKAPILAEAGVN
jgi:nitrogen regulatory protein PII